MANRDLVAIGTSAGGVEALLSLAASLTRDFPASLLVTIHLSPQRRSPLDEILTRAGPLPATFAKHGERLERSHIYLAPPDRHLLLFGDELHLGYGPRENNARPAVDAMLRSVATCCAARSIGVVLTGTLGDGASGLFALNTCGGITVIQDPRDAAFPDMPEAAMERVHPAHVAALSEMPALLRRLVDQPVGKPGSVPDNIRREVEIARTGNTTMGEMDRLGARSVLACPDCHGVMWEIDEGELVRYRCHVGHTYSAEMLSVALDENLARALGSAQRALEERVALARKLAKQAMQLGHNLVTVNWTQKAREYERELDVVRDSIRRMDDIASRAAVKSAESAEAAE
jgi:two-component system chemotaxis response regulator CheB